MNPLSGTLGNISLIVFLKEAIKFRLRIDCVGFNDTSTLVGHFVSSSREREKRDRKNNRGDKKRGTVEKGK